MVPGSHLCHVSVSTWCAANGGVNAGGADKKARCARLTADVAGKTAELVNAYLVSGAYGARGFTGAAIDSGSGTCLACHGTKASMHPVVATGMSCTTCHPDQVNRPHPAAAGAAFTHAGGAPRGAARVASGRPRPRDLRCAYRRRALAGAPLRAARFAGATRFAAPARGGCGAVADT